MYKFCDKRIHSNTEPQLDDSKETRQGEEVQTVLVHMAYWLTPSVHFCMHSFLPLFRQST